MIQECASKVLHITEELLSTLDDDSKFLNASTFPSRISEIGKSLAFTVGLADINGYIADIRLPGRVEEGIDMSTDQWNLLAQVISALKSRDPNFHQRVRELVEEMMDAMRFEEVIDAQSPPPVAKIFEAIDRSFSAAGVAGSTYPFRTTYVPKMSEAPTTSSKSTPDYVVIGIDFGTM